MSEILTSVASKIGLEDRLIHFASTIIDISEVLPANFAATHLAHQIVRSGTSSALNYAEAQGAESRPDFIHKLKISLKELRETYCCLKIIEIKNWIPKDKLSVVLDETIN